MRGNEFMKNHITTIILLLLALSARGQNATVPALSENLTLAAFSGNLTPWIEDSPPLTFRSNDFKSVLTLTGNNEIHFMPDGASDEIVYGNTTMESLTWQAIKGIYTNPPMPHSSYEQDYGQHNVNDQFLKMFGDTGNALTSLAHGESVTADALQGLQDQITELHLCLAVGVLLFVLRRFFKAKAQEGGK